MYSLIINIIIIIMILFAAADDNVFFTCRWISAISLLLHHYFPHIHRERTPGEKPRRTRHILLLSSEELRQASPLSLLPVLAMLLFNPSDSSVDNLATCVSQSTRILILQNTAGTTLPISSFTPLLEKTMGRNVSFFKAYSLTVPSPSSRSSLSPTNPPPLTTRVVSLSTPQARLRAELIDELVTQWNEKMEEMKEGEGESDREKNAIPST